MPHVKLYAQGHVDEGGLEVYLTGLGNQIENPRLLTTSVETDRATEENKMVAASTEAWL